MFNRHLICYPTSREKVKKRKNNRYDKVYDVIERERQTKMKITTKEKDFYQFTHLDDKNPG